MAIVGVKELKSILIFDCILILFDLIIFSVVLYSLLIVEHVCVYAFCECFCFVKLKRDIIIVTGLDAATIAADVASRHRPGWAGHSTSFTCIAKGLPVPDVMWLRSDAEYISSDNIFTITNTRTSDEATSKLQVSLHDSSVASDTVNTQPTTSVHDSFMHLT